MNKTRLILLLSVLAIAGCKKLSKQSDTYTYAIRNDYLSPVNYDVYGSMEDYAANKGMLKRITIAPGKSATADLEAARDYYIDWYTQDQSFSNWSSGTTGPTQIKYTPPKINDVITLTGNSSFRDTSRLMLLTEENYTSSRWLSTGEYNSVGAYIGTPPYIEVKIRKDLKMELKQKDGQGNDVMAVYNISTSYTTLNNRPGFRISGYLPISSTSFQNIITLNFNFLSAVYFPPHQDTLVTSYWSNGSRFIKFVRM